MVVVVVVVVVVDVLIDVCCGGVGGGGNAVEETGAVAMAVGTVSSTLDADDAPTAGPACKPDDGVVSNDDCVVLGVMPSPVGGNEGIGNAA